MRLVLPDGNTTTAFDSVRVRTTRCTRADTHERAVSHAAGALSLLGYEEEEEAGSWLSRPARGRTSSFIAHPLEPAPASSHLISRARGVTVATRGAAVGAVPGGRGPVGAAAGLPLCRHGRHAARGRHRLRVIHVQR